ncbi:Gfo/Idh/MocA family oxidoreductase [Akkermansiaceae bacterium]|jgi:predicted dehydrogenase|nr:Gfo/Idh/MocA family oxidoreductase [Akkermansiaceae bacterium]|tara:strand:+ start:1512 stop:2798 length:1287 start_codon:yes stop_codon:yes gene_type:complete
MSDLQDTNRRAILKTGAAAAATLPIAGFAQAGGSDEIKVATVGCGGRGRGATAQTLNVPGTKLVAVADAFRDRAEEAVSSFRQQYADKVDISADRIFDGFDGFRGAIDAADVVILTTTPGFRPQHFEYAVQQGKHVFMEKPVATDAPGIRKVLEAAKKADEKGLKVVCGLQRHYQPSYIETLAKLKEGIVGDINYGQVYWNSSGVWVRPRVEGMTEMEYQMRNWYYFNWLCGDHIVEQHVHNIDVMNWFKGGPPVKAQGMGGRQVRVGKDYGEIFDHHYVEFTYEDGTVLNSQCRHQKGALNRVTEIIGCQGGKAYPGRIVDAAGKTVWRHRSKDKTSPYQIEHNELYRHIREDKPINNAYYTAASTMTAILGRMATYSGQEIKYSDALEKGLSIMPKSFAWDADPGPKPGKDGLYPCAIPGKTKVMS